MGRNSAERHPIPDAARDAVTPFHVVIAGLDPALHAAPRLTPAIASHHAKLAKTK
jgi:hypothetical protein